MVRYKPGMRILSCLLLLCLLVQLTPFLRAADTSGGQGEEEAGSLAALFSESGADVPVGETEADPPATPASTAQLAEDSGPLPAGDPPSGEGASSEGEVLSRAGADFSQYYMLPEGVSGHTYDMSLVDTLNYEYQFTEAESVFHPVYELDGVTYIVIVNQAQLRAIGTDKPVVGGWATVTFTKTLVAGDFLHQDYEWRDPVVTLHGGDLDAATVEDIGNANPPQMGVEQHDDTTLTVSQGVGDTGLYYTQNANYLIANDIDLSGADWTPWDYSGQFIRGEVTLADGTTRNPVISNITVVEDADLTTPDMDNVRGTSKQGVGFFGALYSPASAEDVEPVEDERPWWDIIGNLLGGLLGLIGGLLDTLGGLVTDLVGVIAGWEDVTTLAVESVRISGLTLDGVTIETDGLYQAVDENGAPQDYAMPVGGFAGQISGDVTLENCHVVNLHAVSGAETVGGFAGKMVGATEYLLHGTTSGLEHTLEGLGGVLDSTLDFLLPTDDLVGGLVSKLGLGNLVPTRYRPAVLSGCTVTMASGAGVSAAGDYAGGFAGKLQGTQLTDCHVSGLAAVSGSSSVGGFAGRIANAYLLGLLQGLGVNLVNFPVGSQVTNCTVTGDGLTVTSTLSDTVSGRENALAYAGGFAGGIMASDVLYDGTAGASCGVTGLTRVSAKGSYVGGFAGYAGVGDVAEALNLLAELLDLEFNLKTGQDGTIEVPLGTGLTDLLDTLLGVNLNAGVLSLIGLNPSQLVGCRVEGEGFAVLSEGGSSVGGFVGFLHGGQIREQPVQRQYDRVQATDGDGTPLYVGVADVTTQADGALNVSGAIYARLDGAGNVIYEDVHGNPVSVTPVTPGSGDTVYHIYDTVFINEKNGSQATLMSTFRDEQWNLITYSTGDQAGTAIHNAADLPGYPNVVFPVYQQRTTPEGYVEFTYHYMDGGETKQVTLYRDGSTYYLRNEDGTYSQYNGVNPDQLVAEALQTAVEDSLEDTGSGPIVTTDIQGLAQVYGVDYVGGVAGQARLCSATDLLSNLTVVQYERFELNNVKLTGVPAGYLVSATAGRAGGAVGYAMGGDITHVSVSNLAAVEATSFAGGFVGQIIPGTVAGQDGNGLELLGLVSVSNLLTVVDAVHTFVNDSSVQGVPDGFTVTARNGERTGAAAGFAAWSVNSKFTSCTVTGLRAAAADGYAGGFCAAADTGSIAGVLDKTFGGVDVGQVLGLSKLLSLLEAFPNRFTGCTVNVGSDLAYTVQAVPPGASDTPGERLDAQNRSGGVDPSCGSAGGFLGYGTAVQVEDCANENLQKVDATSYAGGFGGLITIGSVAQLGSAGLLGEIANLTGLAALLDCAASTLQTSHCQGTAGGYTVTAFDRVTGASGDSWTDMGIAGGFVGSLEGSHIAGCYANHIDTVRGEENAGGFAGRMIPGDVARLADGTSLINHLITIQGGLLSALEIMVPSVKNSYAKCVPCGGTVLSYGSEYAATTGAATPIGVAGGFVGLSAGGQIWGEDTTTVTSYEKGEDGGWSQVTRATPTVDGRENKTGDHSGNAPGQETQVYGTGQTCDILQLLQVDASLYAGGYSGYTRAADLASLGDISLLDGLVDLGGLLSVGQVVVPTQRHTGVTGPLRNVTQAQMDYFHEKNQDHRADFSTYYGYTVGHGETQAAGGYCGVMTTGVVEDSVAYDLISVEAVQQAGGFVGAMLTGGVAQADVESSLLGGLLSGVTSVSDQLLGVVNAIVPAIRTSGVYGYASGSAVTAHQGSAGGFAGTVKGGQIWGEADPADFAEDTARPVHTYAPRSSRCFTKGLRSVTASGSTGDAGGFVGYMGAASVASVGGLELLGIIELPTDLITLLSATVPTVYYADVAAGDDFGFYVEGGGGRSAGGFAGFLQGAQVGMKYRPAVVDPSGRFGGTPEDTTGENISVTGLRRVTGGDYAGGFFGYADAAETLDVSAPDEGGDNENFTLLGLVNLGGVAAIELAKSYIYNSGVTGIAGGYQVETVNAYAWKTAQWDQDKHKAACAGGFGGLLQAGIVRYCAARDLSLVRGSNDAGGFVARMGKSSIIKVDDVATSGALGILSDLLQLGVAVGDVFGSHIQDSHLTGVQSGYAVLAQEGWHEIAGGFVGYADVCRVKNCTAANLRLVMSDEIAGGFMGAMSDAMLISLDVGLLKAILSGVEVAADLIKANRSKVEDASVTGVDSWDGYDVYGGGSSPTGPANTEMGYAGAFLGLSFGSSVIHSSAVYADTVKGTVDQINPFQGTGENTALLANLELDVLLELVDLRGWLSQSTVENSSFQTRSGSTALPSAVSPTAYDGGDGLDQLPSPYYVAANEADLMVEAVTHTLTVTKQLQYQEGAIPNLGDLDYRYTVQVWKDGALIHTALLRPGESTVLANPEAGAYVIRELPQSVLPGDVTPAAEVTVTVTQGQDAQAAVVNTVRAVGTDPPGGTGPGAASGGAFVVNHIPTDGAQPDGIDHPCEILNEIVADLPVAARQVVTDEWTAPKKREPDPEEEA